ncbi:MAG: hypothetical protein WCD35_09865 [Mycobacteriales bacterium]
MYLSLYTFTGPRDTLLEGWHRMAEQIGTQELDLHLAVVTETGLTLVDACPDRATMERFSTSPDFAALVAACDLPMPVVTPLGELHAAFLRSGVAQSPVHA